MDIAALVDRVKDCQIEKVILPVVVFQQIAHEYAMHLEPLRSLREIITTGEQLILTPAILQLCGQLRNCLLHNHYGPSETHVVTAYTFESVPKSVLPAPPIGKPIANTETYILDPHLEPVPVGVVGELYIGGANLGRNYHRHAELTASKFIPHLFAKLPGQRLYRTGDLARFLPDGNIEFLGRKDQQVKIRGFRVELGEIESIMRKFPAVQEAVVMARDANTGGKQLIGYVVGKEEFRRFPIDELRSFLREKLPDFMVPAFLVELDHLPLTSNGKLHRNGLPSPEINRMEAPETFVGPSGPAEELVAGIWRKVLKLERIGIRENFFEIGGHSLLAMQLALRLRGAFGIEVPIRRVFEWRTIADMVEAISQQVGGHGLLAEIAQTLLEVEKLSDQGADSLLLELRADSGNSVAKSSTE
jgi:acyl carrier protein